MRAQINFLKVFVSGYRPSSNEPKEPLLWLLLGRVLVFYFLLAGSFLPRFFSKGEISNEKLLDGYFLMAIGLVTILVQALIPENKSSRAPQIEMMGAAFNLFVDTLLVSLWWYWHPDSSLFLLLYLAIILIFALTFYQAGALYSAIASSVGFGLAHYLHGHADSFYTWGIYSALFFTVGVVGGFLSEELNRARERLTEKGKKIDSLVALQDKILNSLPTGVITADADGIIHFVNPAACSILRKSGQELVGFSVQEKAPELLPFLKESDLKPQQVAEYGHGMQKRILRGEIAEIDISDAQAGGLLSEKAQSGHVLLFQDVTNLVLLEDKLKQHEKLAAIGQLAAGIAHEIRNPLASMSASIEMLRQSPPSQWEEAENHQLMDITLREIDRLNSLITEFLDFVKPENVTFEPVPLAQIIREVLASIQITHQKNPDVKFSVNLEPNAIAMGNPKKIKQVVWNLMTNALQALPQKGIVEVGCSIVNEDQVVFWVQDNGQGMDERVLGHLFEPFFTTKEKGTGLGLATAYSIVESHSGEIKVESEPGKGARFDIVLKRAS